MAKRSQTRTPPGQARRGQPPAAENSASFGRHRPSPRTPAESAPEPTPDNAPATGNGSDGGTLLTVGHPIFAEPTRTQDPLAFGTPHPSDNAVYAKIEELLKTQVVSFPKSRIADDALFGLTDAYGPRGADVVKAITASGRIVFHAVGDTGCSDARRYHEELRVSDQMTMDAGSTEAGNRPAFFFHLGDVVYNFGEARYYYDQFYEPFRAYPGPIIAIAGNHDSFLVPGTRAGGRAARHLHAQFLRRAAGHHHRGRLAAPHRDDGARRLLRARRPVRADNRACSATRWRIPA